MWQMQPSEFGDTDPRALEVFVSLQRKMTPAQKIATVFELTEILLKLSEAGVRKMYPDAGEREVFLRVAARHLDRNLMIQAYGWDPELHDTTRKRA